MFLLIVDGRLVGSYRTYLAAIRSLTKRLYTAPLPWSIYRETSTGSQILAEGVGRV